MAGAESIVIDSTAVRAIVTKAIMEQLGADQQQLLIEQALGHLLEETTVKGQYGLRDQVVPSPLELSFRDAVAKIAREVVYDYLETDAVRAVVREAVVKAIDKKIEEQGSWILEAVGTAAGARVVDILKGEG
jgi:uncharacterized membrane-anchored protein YjiN (DUF445 family)